MFKKIIVGVIIILIFISLIRIFQIGQPTIYKEINHNKTELLNSIERLKEAGAIERSVALSDSITAKLIKTISNKINDINYDYYFVVDYCIDHYQKNMMLSSMSLNEWYEFKQNKDSRYILAGASTVLGPYVSNDYRKEELKRIETEVIKEK
ncbi:MAG: hypothetical protein M0P94_02615 [Candidatus Absconditabacterales bacterium]|nr:hypothetical protein [Candidatus Absconditabacterales bacterium]